MAYSIDYLNLITEQADTYEITALNRICKDVLGGTGGHIYNIDALNEIFELCFSTYIPTSVTMDSNLVGFDHTNIDFSKT